MKKNLIHKIEEGFEIALDIIILLEIIGGINWIAACGIMLLVKTYSSLPYNWVFVIILWFIFFIIEVIIFFIEKKEQ